MPKLNRLKMSCAALMLCAATANVSRAQVFTVLASFDGSDGSTPTGTLAQGRTAYLYGTTRNGGAYTEGVIFKIGIGRTISLLYSFCAIGYCSDGSDPASGLILGSDGDFYGTTSTPYGTVFKVTPTGTLTTIHAFALFDGSEPSGNLVEGIDGNFYGTTAVGGATNAGTVFKISPEGTLTTLHTFCFSCADGSNPQDLMLASDRNLYGTTSEGGTANYAGTIFKITPGGEFSVVYSFCAQPGCADGEQPSSLVQAADGNIYGITGYGGNPSCTQPYSGCGTIFRMTTTGELTTVYSFCSLTDCSDGTRPAGIMQATDGNFYGTTTYGGRANCTFGCGTVFTITPTGALTTLQSLYLNSGEWPFAGLVQATNGELYGTTSFGGGNGGMGTVFALNMGLGPFVSFVQPFGRVGQAGGILGQGFTGTTSVALNGIPANFTVVSDTFIKATIPPGATTGYVTVTTPTGVLTSNVPFRLIP